MVMHANLIDMRAELETLTNFPAMPELARKIVARGSHSDVSEPVAFVEFYSGFAAQMVSQSISSF
jgi:hypothetical protein